MTALNAIAQWLLGGGGDVLKFILYLFVAWVLVGALPRMRRDAAAKVPQVRGQARQHMRDHAAAARAAGGGKGAEWWAWTAAWGAVAVGHESARFGGYVVRSAWRGWGDHRRRVRQLREMGLRRRDAAAPPSPGDGPPPPPPDDGGPPQPDRPGGPSQAAEPPRRPEADRPGGPRRPAEPPQRTDEPEPAHSGADGNGGAEVIPLSRPDLSPAGRQTEGDGTRMPEVSNLETATQVVARMQADAQRALESARLEKARAEQALKDTEQAAADMAAAGVSGPAYEAFVRSHEAMEMAAVSAGSMVTAYESALAAADSAAGALRRHQDAADQLRATGGAADETKWYGAAG